MYAREWPLCHDLLRLSLCSGDLFFETLLPPRTQREWGTGRVPAVRTCRPPASVPPVSLLLQWRAPWWFLRQGSMEVSAATCPPPHVQWICRSRRSGELKSLYVFPMGSPITVRRSHHGAVVHLHTRGKAPRGEHETDRTPAVRTCRPVPAPRFSTPGVGG